MRKMVYVKWIDSAGGSGWMKHTDVPRTRTR